MDEATNNLFKLFKNKIYMFFDFFFLVFWNLLTPTSFPETKPTFV